MLNSTKKTLNDAKSSFWRPILCKFCQSPGRNYHQEVSVCLWTGCQFLDYERTFVLPMCMICRGAYVKYGHHILRPTNKKYYFSCSKRYNGFNGSIHHPFGYKIAFEGSVFGIKDVVKHDFDDLSLDSYLLHKYKLRCDAKNEIIRLNFDNTSMFSYLPQEIVAKIGLLLTPFN